MIGNELHCTSAFYLSTWFFHMKNMIVIIQRRQVVSADIG
jgi:hypothetical protein